MTEREKMQSGQWYKCLDPELEALRTRARVTGKCRIDDLQYRAR